MENIDTYLNSLNTERQEELSKLRNLIKEIIPLIKESMKYHLPNFSLNNITLFQFASQKHFLVFYFSKALMKKYQNELKGLNLGKGSLRFTQLGTVNEEILRKIITEAVDFPLQFSKRGDDSK
ncbi:MAG: DUF1801 domain-containing protein [Candidatus Hodarchaeales archaeon]|jgi:uncharacterized protein YdhG (YjbR/CyaY superfamily)